VNRLIYLASPYSHPDHQVREDRCARVSKVGAKLFQKGTMTYGPIAHSENLARHGGFGDTSWKTFRDFDLLMLSKSDELYILTLDGWKESVGVRAEVMAAIRWNLPIKLINEDLGMYWAYDDDLRRVFAPYEMEDDQYIREVVDHIKPLYTRLEKR